MKIFEKDFAGTPIIVCLNQADRLYEEKYDGGKFPECPEDKVSTLKKQFQCELEVIAKDAFKPKLIIYPDFNRELLAQLKQIRTASSNFVH